MKATAIPKRKLLLTICLTLVAIIVVFTATVWTSSAHAQDQGSSSYDSVQTLADLEGATLALNDGNSSYADLLIEKGKLSGVDYYTGYADTFNAVSKGIEDCAFVFESFFPPIKEQCSNLTIVDTGVTVPIVAMFSSSSDDLKERFNAYIEKALADGSIDQLYDKWITHYDEQTSPVSFDDLTGENGSFIYAVSDQNPPMSYLIDTQLSGFEVQLVHDFCKSEGLKPELMQMTYDAAMAGTTSGKYDMSTGGYGYTEERAESVNFSDPYIVDKICFAVRAPQGENGTDFFTSLVNRFKKSFITDNRWKLIVDGLATTMLITFCAVGAGTILGFLLFLCLRKLPRVCRVIRRIYKGLDSIPILVILMIFFYIIFGKSTVSGVLISIMVFGIMFTLLAFDLFLQGEASVPAGQMEAALAIGYTESKALFKVVIPQALRAILPAYQGAVISYLKGTAVVGYVAVQDLTKAGDIIRSLTFDAFFPILGVALVYFIIAQVIIALLGHIRTDNHQRDPRKFLKGVKR